MTFPTHILAGLIIGKLTGDYTAALTGSLVMDVDHLFSYHRHGILLKPKRILRESLTAEDPWGDQKNFLHSAQSWFFVSLLLSIIDLKFGLIFSGAYLVHLILDAMTGEFYPFYPYKKSLIKKPIIGYLSKREVALGLVLMAVFFIL
ncbi:MAG: metal-dependent hydrolase [bacterium]|nr:metal-dependent hydrolase [bacterium]